MRKVLFITIYLSMLLAPILAKTIIYYQMYPDGTARLVRVENKSGVSYFMDSITRAKETQPEVEPETEPEPERSGAWKVWRVLAIVTYALFLGFFILCLIFDV